jgi:hypothetical protein
MNKRELKKALSQAQEKSVGHECKADKIPTHLEARIDGAVEIEFFEKFKDSYEAAQHEDKTYKNKVFWLTLFSTVLIALYAAITGYQASLTKDLVVNGQEQAHRDLRPYIYAEKLDVIGSIDAGQWKGQVEVTNTGKTPGIKVEGCADFAFRPPNRPMTDDLVCPNPENPATGIPTTGEKSKFVLGPARPFSLYTSGFSMKITQVVQPPYDPNVSFGKVLSTGGFFLYIYGDITYTDLIDQPAIHTTRFCGRYNPDSKLFEVCEKRNWMN